MKIMFINGVVDFGSTGRIVRDLSNGLIDAGHDTLIAYGRKNSLDDSNTFSIVSKYSTLYHVLMTRVFGRHGLHSKQPTKRLIKKIQEYKPDVIHLHNIHGYYLNYPILFDFLKNNKDIKIIWTHHDCWSFSGNSAYFDYHGCKVWDNGCVICESKRDYPEVSLFVNQEKNFKRKKSCFSGLSNITHVTPSNWLTDMMKSTFHNYAEIITINNGIDTTVFRPIYNAQKLETYGINPSKKILLGVASDWEPRKGLSIFVELSKTLKEDEQLVLVGIDSKTKLQLPDNIVSVSRTNDVHDLALLYSHAHLFLNPTLEDNFPTTNLESLSCGTPVITFKTGGSGEGITNDCGTLVTDKTVIGLRRAINDFIIQDNTSKLCRELALEKFDKKLSNQRYLDLIIKGE